MKSLRSMLYGALKSVKATFDPGAEFSPYDSYENHPVREPQQPKFSFTSKRRISIRF